MRSYSEAVKADVRRRMSPPNRQNLVEIAQELGIHSTTLYKWRQAWRLQGEGTAAELIANLTRAQQQGDLVRALSTYGKPKLLIIDELGYLPLEHQAVYLLFQLISRRYEQGSVLISSNRAVTEWGEVFGDQVVATAILDRLLHHSQVITIRGDSYRLREKRRSGLIRPAAGSSLAGGGVVPPPPPAKEA